MFVSEPLAGEPVGIAETDSGRWIVRFADIDLGIIDRRAKANRTGNTVTYLSGCSPFNNPTGAIFA